MNVYIISGWDADATLRDLLGHGVRFVHGDDDERAPLFGDVVVFVDLDPEANYEHPVLYVLLCDDGMTITAKGSWPPAEEYTLVKIAGDHELDMSKRKKVT